MCNLLQTLAIPLGDLNSKEQVALDIGNIPRGKLEILNQLPKSERVSSLVLTSVYVDREGGGRPTNDLFYTRHAPLGAKS